MADLILDYLKEIEKEASRGVATEHTYRPALKKLVEGFDKGIVAVNELSALHLMEFEVGRDRRARRDAESADGSASRPYLQVAFPIAGSSEVEKGFPKFNVDAVSSPCSGGSRSVATGSDRAEPSAEAGQTGRVYINKMQYFDGVPSKVWNFTIGGYQVCEKWLKDRRERTLTHDDLQHYKKIVAALSRTIELMSEIDATVPQWPVG